MEIEPIVPDFNVKIDDSLTADGANVFLKVVKRSTKQSTHTKHAAKQATILNQQR